METRPARPVHDDDLPLAGTEVHYLRSAHVGDEFKLFVARCGTDDAIPARVLYLTDANGTFGSAVDIIRSMQLRRHLPPLLVIGIGYRLGGIEETVVIRTRDLTPTCDPAYARIFPDQAAMGGAASFLAFIRTELKPWAESRYRVDASDSAYFGHSLGGLFGLYSLLSEPETFQRYVLGSPSIWWHYDVIFDIEDACARRRDDLPASVFFGIGADETHEGRRRESINMPAAEQAKATARYIDMVDDMDKMVRRLKSRQYPSLTVSSAVFPDEFHVTVPQLNLARGLRVLFDAPR